MVLTASVRTIGLTRYSCDRTIITDDEKKGDAVRRFMRYEYVLDGSMHGPIFPNSIRDTWAQDKNGEYEYVEGVVHLKETVDKDGEIVSAALISKNGVIVPVTFGDNNILCHLDISHKVSNGIESNAMWVETDPMRSLLGYAAQPLMLVTIPIDIVISATVATGALISAPIILLVSAIGDS